MPSGTFVQSRLFWAIFVRASQVQACECLRSRLKSSFPNLSEAFLCWTGPNMDEGGWILLSNCEGGSFCSGLQSEYCDFWRLPERHLGCSLKGAGVWKALVAGRTGRTTGWHDLKERMAPGNIYHNASPVELPQATQLTQLRPKFR